MVCSYYGDKVLCTDFAWADWNVAEIYRPGRSMPLFRGAMAKVILANHSTSHLRSIWTWNEAANRDAGLGDTLNAFLDGMAEIRAAGVMITRGEVFAGVVGVAAPVFDLESQVLGSVVFVLPVQRYEAANPDQLKEEIRELARASSAASTAPCALMRLPQVRLPSRVARRSIATEFETDEEVVMSEVKLYLFQTGSLQCKYHDIYLNQGEGKDFEIPVPFYVIDHPNGLVVIDGGTPEECATDPYGHWGAVVDFFKPVLNPGDGCVAQMERVGLDPARVTHVVLSHLHLDHVGAIGRFPGAKHIVQRAEMNYARSPDWFQVLAYVRKDVDRAGVDWFLLDESWGDFYDLFGDGTVTLIRSPGTPPGISRSSCARPGRRCFSPSMPPIRWTIGRNAHCPARCTPPSMRFAPSRSCAMFSARRARS